MRAATGKGIGGGKVVVGGGKVVEGSTVSAFGCKPDEELKRDRLAGFWRSQVVREALEGDFLEDGAEPFLKHFERRFWETGSA